MISNASLLKVLVSELAELSLLRQKPPTQDIIDRWCLLALACEGRFSIEDLENHIKSLGAPNVVVTIFTESLRKVQATFEPQADVEQLLKDIAK